MYIHGRNITHSARLSKQEQHLKKKKSIFLHYLRDNGTCMMGSYNSLTLSKTGLCSNTFRMSRGPPATSFLHGCWLFTACPLGSYGRAGYSLGCIPFTHTSHFHHYDRVQGPDNVLTLCPQQSLWASCQVCVCVCILFVDFTICIVFISYITHTHKYRCSSYYFTCT